MLSLFTPSISVDNNLSSDLLSSPAQKVLFTKQYQWATDYNSAVSVWGMTGPEQEWPFRYINLFSLRMCANLALE